MSDTDGHGCRRFEGRAAIVTGASRGIGRAIALRLASEGARVLVNYNTRRDAADDVAAAIQAVGSQAVVVQADVARAADVDRLIQAGLAVFDNRIDVLVNNAGITRDQLIMRMSEEDWESVLDTNLKSAFLVTKAILRPMLRQRYGRIVNITSVSGIMGNAGQANYSASKAGLIGLTRSIAREVAGRNITCNAVAPGFVPTDLTNALLKQMEETILRQIPLGRFGTVDDVANAIAFLVSDEASYITGQVLVVDGGMVTA